MFGIGKHPPQRKPVSAVHRSLRALHHRRCRTYCPCRRWTEVQSQAAHCKHQAERQNGVPQRFGSSVIRLKYSWKVKRILLEITAACHDLRYGRKHCVNSAVIRAPAGQIRIIAVAHHGNGIAFALAAPEASPPSPVSRSAGTCRHNGINTAACADGAVEHLHQALLGAYI